MLELLLRINRVMVRYPSLRWIYTVAKKVGIVDMLYWINAKYGRTDGEKIAAFKQMYEQHKDDIRRVSEMLEDDLSRRTLEKVLEFRMTWDPSVYKGVWDPHQYFVKDIILPVKDEVFVDGGAYVGDTITEFLKFCGGGVTKRFTPGSLTPKIAWR